MKCSNTPVSLVNFRMSQSLLEPFNHACSLSGKTRTQVITEMVQDYVKTIGSRIPETIKESNRINLLLKNTAMNVQNVKRDDPFNQCSIGSQSGLRRKFSSFIRPISNRED